LSLFAATLGEDVPLDRTDEPSKVPPSNYDWNSYIINLENRESQATVSTFPFYMRRWQYLSLSVQPTQWTDLPLDQNNALERQLNKGHLATINFGNNWTVDMETMVLTPGARDLKARETLYLTEPTTVRVVAADKYQADIREGQWQVYFEDQWSCYGEGFQHMFKESQDDGVQSGNYLPDYEFDFANEQQIRFRDVDGGDGARVPIQRRSMRRLGAAIEPPRYSYKADDDLLVGLTYNGEPVGNKFALSECEYDFIARVCRFDFSSLTVEFTFKLSRRP